jgi:hypothetical protein
MNRERPTRPTLDVLRPGASGSKAIGSAVLAGERSRRWAGPRKDNEAGELDSRSARDSTRQGRPRSQAGERATRDEALRDRACLPPGARGERSCFFFTLQRSNLLESYPRSDRQAPHFFFVSDSLRSEFAAGPRGGGGLLEERSGAIRSRSGAIQSQQNKSISTTNSALRNPTNLIPR